jgi:GTPase SAR1 family protein
MSLNHLFKAHDSDKISSNDPVLKDTKAVQMCIIGAKRSGKSSLILSLLSSSKLYKSYFGNIFMISPSNDGKMGDLIREIDSDGKYYKELNETNIQSVLDYIKQEQNAKKMKEKKLKKKLPEIYNLLILDDVMADLPRSFKKNKITSLFMNARHYNLSTIIVSQVYKGIPNSIRKQTDIFYTFPLVKKEKEAMMEDWDIPEEIFDQAFNDESDHPFLTINCVSKTHPSYFRKMTRI